MKSKYRFSMDLFADELTDVRQAGTRAGDSGDRKTYGFLRNVMDANPNHIRIDRILALRLALNSGSYSVSASELAARLMESMLCPR